MKRKKSFFGSVILSILLGTNVFAGGFTTGDTALGLLGSIYNVVYSLVASSSCETRQCQTCKPTERDGEGNCRPTP